MLRKFEAGVHSRKRTGSVMALGSAKGSRLVR